MLADVGFEQVDAKVYVYLAKKGLQKASEICKAAKLTKQQLYPSLKRLQRKGIVTSTIERPARFSAMPFERVLDLSIQAKIEETRNLQQNKAEILSNWQNLKLEDDGSSKFSVIEGRTFIYSKIQQMIQEARTQVVALITVPTLIQADQRDIFNVSCHPLKSSVLFRFLTELSEQNVHVMKALLKELAVAKFNVEGRNPDLGLTMYPQMLLRDQEEAIFFTKPRTETSIIEKHDVCLWTDCKTLVKSFTAIFEDLWRNSTDIQEKITEIETGKPKSKTFIIGNAEIAKKEYNKTVNSAKEEILIMTSSNALVDFGKNKPQLNEWIEKGVAVKIMAPIADEDLEAAKQLSKVCSVKHVPPNYQPTTIIDGKHLFQFKKPISRAQLPDSSLNSDITMYTNNPEYVQKMKNMLNEIWRNACPFSADNLKTMFVTGARSQSAFFPGAIRSPGPEGKFNPVPPVDPEKRDSYAVIEIVNEDPLGKLTEKDVLNEIITGQDSRPKERQGLNKIYSSQAIAIIHPPAFFKLPPMLIRVHHIEKHSTFGEENVIMISLWRETINGPAYVPVAVLSDKPKAQAIWGKHFEASPAGQNVQFAKKDELLIRIHGNTLFAGWTVPITLYPSEYILPPACMLIEGYGNVKTEAYSIVQPTGGKFTARQNGFNAFVTFIHPSSKYSGPGTDGFFIRDFVMEITPQFIEGFDPKLETKLIEKKKEL